MKIKIYLITFYPNPFTLQTTITFQEEQKNTEIEITDILGRKVMHVILSAARNLTIDKETMQPGIYFVSILKDTSKQVLKLIKN